MKDEIKKALEQATPGPWEVMNGRDIFTPGGAINRAGIKADNNDGWHIADVMCGPTNVNGEDWEMGYVEKYANAHLIANAPTWLKWQNERIEQLEKALEEIAEYDVRLLHGFIDEWEDAAAFGKCQEIAHQALGKEE